MFFNLTLDWYQISIIQFEVPGSDTVYWRRSLTDCLHDVGEEAEGHEGLGKLAKEKFQRSRDDMNVLPFTLVQIQLLLWETRREDREEKTD